jgi:hypothetical protein
MIDSNRQCFFRGQRGIDALIDFSGSSLYFETSLGPNLELTFIATRLAPEGNAKLNLKLESKFQMYLNISHISIPCNTLSVSLQTFKTFERRKVHVTVLRIVIPNWR